MSTLLEEGYTKLGDIKFVFNKICQP